MNRIIVLLVTMFILTFSLSSTISAQDGRGNGRLKGFVYDSDKKPVEGVNITLQYLSFNRLLSTTTDKKGKFIFMGLGLGAVKISAEKEGFVLGGNKTTLSGAKKNLTQYIVLKRMSEVKPVEDENARIKNDFANASKFYKSKKYKEALELFKSFLEKKPDMYKVGINVGNCYLELKQYKNAIIEFEKVLKKITEETPKLKGNKTVAQILATIGEIYMRQDDLINAEKYFKKSISIDQSDQALSYNIAEILFSAGKTDDSIIYYSMAIKTKPQWAIPYKQIGYAYLNKGNIKKAIEMFQKFISLDPESSETQALKDVIKSLK